MAWSILSNVSTIRKWFSLMAKSSIVLSNLSFLHRTSSRIDEGEEENRRYLSMKRSTTIAFSILHLHAWWSASILLKSSWLSCAGRRLSMSNKATFSLPYRVAMWRGVRPPCVSRSFRFFFFKLPKNQIIFGSNGFFKDSKF